MLEQINRQLDNVKNKIAKKYVLENKLNKLNKELEKSKEALNHLEKELIKEKRDVENLKKLSLSNIVSTMIGNKNKKILKEEEEYILAKIKYDNCQSRVDLVSLDIKDIRDRLKSLEGYEDEYKILLKKKIQLINKYSNEETKSKIIQIEKQADIYLNEITETEESIVVGNRLINEILLTKRLLESAKSWSTFDIFGGDLLSSMAKHSKIDEAQNHFTKIYSLTKSFNKELSDVDISGVGLSSSTKTFDILFDNIFSDLTVDKYISESYDNLCSLEKSVDSTLRTLRIKKQKLNIEVNNLRNEYDEFITGL